MKNFFNNLILDKYKEPKIIVEISGNHQNSYKKLKKLIDESIKQKVDAIKFQLFTADTISFNSTKKDFKLPSQQKWKGIKSRYKVYEKAHTPWKWVEKLAKYLRKKKIPWFATPFDKTSLDFLEKINCPAYKIASPEINDLNLINLISKTKKPVLISTGMATLKDLDEAVKIIKKNNKKKIIILKCTSSYPASYKELDLNLIKYLSTRYSCPIGFSDHTIGELAPIVAASLGAKVIEKHFKLDSDNNSIDSFFSMKISNYQNLKNNIKLVSQILGNKKNFPLKLKKKLLNERRSLYAVKDIKKGEKFSEDNIKSIRPGKSLAPKYFKDILGRRSKINFKSGDRLSLQYIV